MSSGAPVVCEVICKTAADNLQQLATIHQQAFSELGQTGWGPDTLSETCASTGAVLVAAFSAEQPIGLALFQQVLDEAELVTLAVAPEHQGKSIASKLMQWAETKLAERGVRTFFLEVRADNATAIRLYENLDFKATSVRKGYYKVDGDVRIDAVNYSKTLV